MAQDYNTGTIQSRTYADEVKASRPEATVTGALRDLAEAARVLSLTTEAFINARLDLTEARDRFNACRDVVAKEQESANV